jgi:DNA primase
MFSQMGHIPQETIERVAAANDIVDVVGSYFPLKRAGAAYRARCPFHEERTPSFQVNPQKQIFKCFGCGAGGGVFRFVEMYDHVDFPTAVRKLADRAGIRIVEEQLSADDEARVTMRRRLLALHAEAAEFFHQQLMRNRSAQQARDYLKSRGIGSEIAKSWRLGYAPDAWDAMRAFAQGAGFSIEEIIRSGLVKVRADEQPEIANASAPIEQTEFYDRFRHRVMFPICDEQGQVIGFSGRVLDAEAQEAKYVNSPETMLFKKGEVLFGLHKSVRALIAKSSAIVCEGQLDLITAFEAGVTNVVAPQGTAFTPKQAHKLRRYVEEAVLCYDADSAGQSASEKSARLLLAEAIAVRVATMPPGEDPDSMIRRHGGEAFLARIAGAKDFFDFQIDALAARPEFATPRGRMLAARKLAESISCIGDAVLRETILHRVSMRLEVSAQELVKLLKAPRPDTRGDELDEPIAEARPKLDPTLALLVKVALTDAEARQWLREQDWEPTLGACDESGLVQKVIAAELDVDDPASVAGLLSNLEMHEEAEIVEILEGRKPEFSMIIAHDCWNELERRQIDRRVAALQARLRAPELPIETILSVQKEVLDLQKRRSEIARPFSPPL